MMQSARCSCGECRALDQLPDRLQGWPGAWQATLFGLGGKTTVVEDNKAKAACRERCAVVGDPPCFEIQGDGPVDKPFVWSACAECLRDCGIEIGDELDPRAVVRPLL